jgi:hypothetical protein
MADDGGPGRGPPYPTAGPPYPGQFAGGGYPGPSGPPPPYPDQPHYPGYQGCPPPQSPYPNPGVPGQLPWYPPAGYGGPDPYARRGFSGFAIASFVTGLVLPLVGIVTALPLGIIALVKISRSRDKGGWMAVTGIVLSGLWWVAIMALGLWIDAHTAHRNDAGQIDRAGTISFAQVRDGDCLSMSGMHDTGIGGSVTVNTLHLKGIPCAESHDAQALHIAVLSASSYPGDYAIRSRTERACAPAYASFAPTGYRSLTLYPKESTWNATDSHRAICLVVAADLQPTQGSVVR